MKWKPIARQIADNLYRTNYLNTVNFDAALELINTNDAVGAFRYIAENQNTPPQVGWNKTWRGQELSFWYGGIAFTQSLRLIALEIDSIPKLCDKIRHYLNKIFDNRLDASDSTLENQLSLYALSSSRSEISKQQLMLLQRLNADQREYPIIERWHWSHETGIAYLSDGGQISASLDLAWSRALESLLSIDKQYTTLIDAFISSIKPDRSTILLPTALENKLISFINILQFYGLGYKLGNIFQLKAPAGEFPATFHMLYT